MREPDSLDEQALQDDPPEYQHPEEEREEILQKMRELTIHHWHPEDLLELYREYERTIDELYPDPESS